MLDITDPSHVGYCFVDIFGMESEREVQLMTPLSARTYVEAYDDTRNVSRVVESLKEWDLIQVAVLQDAWPSGKWEEPAIDERAKNNASPVTGIAPKENMMSLRERAMDCLIQTLLDESEGDPQIISDAELLTDFPSKLKHKLYEKASVLKSFSLLVHLLCRVLKDDTEVDLSPFKTLAADDLSGVVSKLQEHGHMSTLNLSNRPDLTETDLGLILKDVSTIKSLLLLECIQISAESLLSQQQGCEVLHSELLRRSFKNSHRLMPSSQSTHESFMAPVTHIYWTSESACRLENGNISWGMLDLECLHFKEFSIVDKISHPRLVGGLLQLLKWASHADIYAWPFSKDISYVAMHAFAMPLFVASGLGNRVRPLTQITRYERKTPGRHPTAEEREHRAMDQTPKAGKWAIIVLQDDEIEPFDRLKSTIEAELAHYRPRKRF